MNLNETESCEDRSTALDALMKCKILKKQIDEVISLCSESKILNDKLIIRAIAVDDSNNEIIALLSEFK